MSKKSQLTGTLDLVTTVTVMKLTKEIEQLKERHKETCEMAVRSILQALDCKDRYTYGHSMRVAYYALTLGREVGLTSDELYELELSTLFHDVGKIGIPDSILLKPSRLTEEEFLIMKTHPVKSAEILNGFQDFEKIATYAKHHHERFDGMGYPSKLKGEDIPYFSRMILIADTFDAMTSTRSYRNGLDYEVAYNELQEFSGTQFDPYLVRNFITAMEKDKAKQEESFKLTIIKEKFNKAA